MDNIDPAHPRPDPRKRNEAAPAKSLRAWHFCALAVPFVGLLFPSLYARSSPQILGIPFFYAYQFLWIFVSAGLTALVYRDITR